MQIRKWNTRAILAAAALAVVAPSVWAQTTTWNGTVDNLWTNSSNWDAGVPSSGSISLFNNAGNGNTTITLSGASQPVGTILFDTSSVAAYMLGDGSAGDVFSLDAGGGIAITSTVAANQTIGAAILMNGSGTFINNSVTSSLILGVAGSPATITLASNGSLGINDAAGAGSSIIVNDVIKDTTAGTGVVIYNGNSGGLIQVNSLSTYSGTTLFNGSSGSHLQFNHDFNTGDTSGPFGTGTIVMNATSNNSIEPAGADRTLVNPVVLNFGFTVGSITGDVHSLALNGPITMLASGRSITNNFAGGATLTLGSATSPSTFTLPTVGGTNTNLTGSGATVVNDTIQDATGAASNIVVAGTGYVTFNGAINSAGNETVNNNSTVTFNAPITVNTTTISGDKANVTYNAAITSTANTTISGVSSIVTYNGTASGGNLSVNNTTQTTGNVAPVVTINAPRGGAGNVTFSAGTTGFAGTLKMNAQNTYSGTTTLSGLAANILVGTNSTMSGSTLVSGPFGTGTLIVNNVNGPPIFQPIGDDRTIANVVTFSSGMFAATASAGNDPTGPHNLTFSGTLNMTSGGKVVTNNILSGGSLIFGTAGSPSTLTISSGVMQLQTNTAGNGKTIVINDFVTGNAGITVKNNQTAYFNNANSYVGATTVTGDSDALGYGALYVNNTGGSGTGSSTVTVRGNNTGVGKGGTLGGTGSLSGAVAISSATAGQQGGNLSPGTSGLGTRGTLTVGSMTWNPVGRYVFEYNASDTTQGGGVNDLVSSAGALDLSSLTANSFDLNLNPYAGTPSGTPVTYVIANFAGGITKPGAIVNNDVSSLFTFSGLFGSTPTVMIDSGNPNLLDLTFAPVPEPTTILLSALGTIGLGLRPKRRRRMA
jgi:hypothetical protein